MQRLLLTTICFILGLGGASAWAEQALEYVGTYALGSNYVPNLAVSPDDAFIYATARVASGHELVGLERDLSSGALLGRVSHIGRSPRAWDIVVSPDGRFLFAGSVELLTTYRRDAVTGALRLVETREGLGNGYSVAVSPDGGFVYLIADLRQDASYQRRQLLVFAVEREALRLVQILPPGSADHDLVVTRDGRQVYSVGDDIVTTFKRDLVSGKLARSRSLTGIDGTSDAFRIAITADDESVFVTGRSGSVVEFVRHPSNGRVTHVGTYREEDRLVAPLSIVFPSGGGRIVVGAKGRLVTLERGAVGELILNGVQSAGLDPSGGQVAVASDTGGDVYAVDGRGRLAHYRFLDDVPTPLSTPTSTYTETPTPTVTGTRSATPTRTPSSTRTSNRPSLVARADAFPSSAVSGQTVQLDGSRSSGARVSSWSWSQVAPADPRVVLKTVDRSQVEFIAPYVDRPTRFQFRLDISGLGGSPPQFTNSTLVSVEVRPFVTVTPGGPTLTPTAVRTATYTRTPSPTRTPSFTSAPMFSICGCVAEVPGSGCGERLASVSFSPSLRKEFLNLHTGEFCFDRASVGRYKLSVTPRCNAYGCRPDVEVTVADESVWVEIPLVAHTPESLATDTVTPTPTPLSEPTPTLLFAPGDCDADGDTGIDDLMMLVRLALYGLSAAPCSPGDLDGDDRIGIDEIVRAIAVALDGF